MARRVYVKVVLQCDADGNILPLQLEWEDGETFQIDRLLDVRRAPALKAGGQGMRFTIRVRGQQTYLFEDEGRWFVEGKA